MTAVAIQIVRCADESQPGWVECELSDAAGHRHAFLEKIPVVSREKLWRESDYPRDGVIACTVVSRWVDAGGRALAKIDTSRPWGVESKDGTTEFVVGAESLRVLD
eukprot:TRINITY_DN41660_c0_g1_i1.p3 TRINITY_DN41660_c0_g1~~TRINITY_DN41660_c0_g1_i1.p3  ORF type:complete len:106 (-),score=17.72 TRINITY_DN41660_c0_g1_i1:119-436(-)